MSPHTLFACAAINRTSDQKQVSFAWASLFMVNLRFHLGQAIATVSPGQSEHEPKDERAAEDGHDPTRPGRLQSINLRPIRDDGRSKHQRPEKSRQQSADDPKNDRRGNAHILSAWNQEP